MDPATSIADSILVHSFSDDIDNITLQQVQSAVQETFNLSTAIPRLLQFLKMLIILLADNTAPLAY
jgi:hypothetical protein